MSEEKKRAAMHNARKGKNGVFNPKHNDRDFDVKNSDHIDPEKTKYNWTWHRYQDTDPNMSFDDAEALFYEEHCREILDVKNDACIRARHPERVKTMDEFRKSIKTCPEEQFLEIGKIKNTVPPDVLHAIAIDQMNWEAEMFPQFVILDVSLHVDEPNIAPHMHKRGVWLAHDEETGLETINQTKALKEMGVEAPHPEKKISRYNNPKVTHSRLCREHFLQLCKEHGLEIETEPKSPGKSGLAFEEYKKQEIRRKAEEEAKAIREAAEKDAAEIRNRTDFAKGYEEGMKDAAAKTKQKFDSKEWFSGEEYREALKQVSDLTQENNGLRIELGEVKAELENIKGIERD